MNNVSYDNIKEWAAALEERKRLDAPESAGVVPPGPPPNVNQMSDRLSRLEGAFDWIKVTIAVIAAVVIGVIAFVGVQITRVDGKISTVSEKVDALPDRINANLRDLTNTLAQAMLASRQIAPQVILMPTPQTATSQPHPPHSLNFKLRHYPRGNQLTDDLPCARLS